MHVAIVNYAYDPVLQTPAALLRSYTALTGWAAGLAQAGAHVTVLQRFSHDTLVEEGEITYRFIADRCRPSLRRWQVPLRLHRQVREVAPAIVHINGLGFPIQARALRARLPGHSAMVAQHRADRPARGYWKPVQRQGLAVLDGLLFAAREIATPWLRAGLLRADQPIFEIVGGSTGFRVLDRAAARARTGLRGDPIVLWVGRLDQNKDPLTVLRGFEQVVPGIPGARFYMVYASTPLLEAVQTYIAASPVLTKTVTLLGQIPYLSLEAYYNSADYFVLGSHHESSGFALVEAMACGVVPLVTDIPSFRRMTGAGTVGALWQPGDATGFAQVLTALLSRPREPLAQAARRFFDDNLSWPALGCQALDAYTEVVWRRTAPGTH